MQPLVRLITYLLTKINRKFQAKPCIELNSRFITSNYLWHFLCNWFCRLLMDIKPFHRAERKCNNRSFALRSAIVHIKDPFCANIKANSQPSGAHSEIFLYITKSALCMTQRKRWKLLSHRAFQLSLSIGRKPVESVWANTVNVLQYQLKPCIGAQRLMTTIFHLNALMMT